MAISPIQPVSPFSGLNALSPVALQRRATEIGQAARSSTVAPGVLVSFGTNRFDTVLFNADGVLQSLAQVRSAASGSDGVAAPSDLLSQVKSATSQLGLALADATGQAAPAGVDALSATASARALDQLLAAELALARSRANASPANQDGGVGVGSIDDNADVLASGLPTLTTVVTAAPDGDTIQTAGDAGAGTFEEGGSDPVAAAIRTVSSDQSFAAAAALYASAAIFRYQATFTDEPANAPGAPANPTVPVQAVPALRSS